MKRTALIPLFGFAASTAMLALKLPFASVGTTGVIATVAFYVLNPPFFLVQLFAPHGAHELEHSSWPTFQYTVAFVVSLAWWAFIAWQLRLRRRKGQS